MALADEILQERGVDFDDLKDFEKKTYFDWLQKEEKSIVTLDDVKAYVSHLRMSIELELIKTPPYTMVLFFRIPNRSHALLTARLHNMILLESLLNRQERARQILEAYRKQTPMSL